MAGRLAVDRTVAGHGLGKILLADALLKSEVASESLAVAALVVDPIDDCNPSSANALLKILEEPPPDTTFFLVSHRPGSLLPTIKSRCHSLGPLDGDTCTAVTLYSGQLVAQSE